MIENIFDVILEVHSKGGHAEGKFCDCYELKIRFFSLSITPHTLCAAMLRAVAYTACRMVH